MLEYGPSRTAGECETIVVPLDASGRPVAPFTPGRRRPRPDGRSARYDSANIVRRAAALLTNGPFRGSVTPLQGRLPFDDGRLTTAAVTVDGCVALAYRVDADGRLAVTYCDVDRVSPGLYGRPHLAAGAFLLLVPPALVRPADLRDAARIRAAVLTPFTAAADLPLYAGAALITVASTPFALLFVIGVSSN